MRSTASCDTCTVLTDAKKYDEEMEEKMIEKATRLEQRVDRSQDLHVFLSRLDSSSIKTVSSQLVNIAKARSLSMQPVPKRYVFLGMVRCTAVHAYHCFVTYIDGVV